MSKFQTLSILGLSVVAGIAHAEESPLTRSLTQALKKDPSVCERVAEIQKRIDTIGQNGHAEQVMDVRGDFLPVITQKGHLDDEVAFRSEQGLLPLVTATTASQAQMEITELLDASLKRLSKTYLDNQQKVKALEAKRIQGFGIFMSAFERDQLDILKSQRDTHIRTARDICRDMEVNRVAHAYLRHTLVGGRASRTKIEKLMGGMSEKQLRNSGLLESWD